MKRKISLILVALIAALSFASCSIVPLSGADGTASLAGDGLEVHFIDVGQADSALILCQGESMLIDGGNMEDSSTIVTYLKKQGVKHLNYVICTHGHEDHVGGLSGALNACSAGKVLSSCLEYDSKAFENFVKYAEKQELSVQKPEPGDEFFIGDARVTVLGPLREYEEENDNSVVLRVDYGETSFLFTGDMETAAEADLIDSGASLEADVLKVGHHGSSTSSSYRFLRKVMPAHCVISCGKDNSYGHPHDEILSRLRDADTQLYRTDLQGDIIAESDGSTVTFKTGKNQTAQTNPTNKEDRESRYIGNKKSRKFHGMSCSSLPKEENAVYFDQRDAAMGAGYSPCGSCEP